MPRQKLPIEPKHVEQMAACGCSNREIAAVFGAQESTIGKRFRFELERGRGRMKTRLRMKQMKMALKGSVPMLIWLGKQMLGQTDKQETKSEASVVVKEGGIDTSPRPD